MKEKESKKQATEIAHEVALETNLLAIWRTRIAKYKGAQVLIRLAEMPEVGNWEGQKYEMEIVARVHKNVASIEESFRIVDDMLQELENEDEE